MRAPVFAALAFALAGPAAAQNQHIGDAAAPIAKAVLVPAGSETLYVSGMTPPRLNAAAPAGSPPAYGDTRTQVAGILGRIHEILAAQGYGFGDVVMMRVYLVGDPAMGGRMDFAGMMAAYKEAFGTAAQPNKPARVTVQVSALVDPTMLAEIEVQAARPRR
jgi:enamine deaminase RidA (YjgF/YER057c/UK114 family)